MVFVEEALNVNRGNDLLLCEITCFLLMASIQVCRYCSLPIPGYWIPAIPAGMTEWWDFSFARHPGMDAGTHRPWKASIKGVVKVDIMHFPSLVTGFRRSLPE